MQRKDFAILIACLIACAAALAISAIMLLATSVNIYNRPATEQTINEEIPSDGDESNVAQSGMSASDAGRYGMTLTISGSMDKSQAICDTVSPKACASGRAIGFETEFKDEWFTELCTELGYKAKDNVECSKAAMQVRDEHVQTLIAEAS